MIVDALAGKATSKPFGRNFCRQFIYVDDTARALVTALNRSELPRDTYTITGDSYLTIAEIAEVVRSVLMDKKVTIGDGDDPVDDRQSRFDTSAAKRDLDFSPKYSFADGVRAYADRLRHRASDGGGRNA